MTRALPALLAAALVAAGADLAHAVCPVSSACSATPFLSNPACCGSTSCTIDGVVTTSGADCVFDFDGRTVNITGQLNAGSNTVTMFAGSLRVSGKLTAVGASGNPGGNLLITTTGGAALAFSVQPGIGTAIDVSGFGSGGTVSVLADGPVQLLAGTLRADGLDASSSGGTVRFESSSGDITVAVPVTATSGLFNFGGSIDLVSAGDLTLTDAGRLAAIGGASGAGTIALEAAGAVTVPTGARIQVNALPESAGIGGEIDVTAGSIAIQGVLEAKGGTDVTLDAGGDGGIINLEARTADIALTRGTAAVIVDSAPGGFFGGEVNLFTSHPTLGAVNLNAPMSATGIGSVTSRPASGGGIAVDAAAGLTVDKTINVDGSGGFAGVVDLAAGGDVVVDSNVSGIDPFQGGTLTIGGLNVTVNGNLLMRSSPDTSGTGGEITITAGLDAQIQGLLLDASGSGTGEGGTIHVEASRDLTLAQAASLDASSGGTAADSARSGRVSLLAGFPDLAGNLTVAGDVTAIGRSPIAAGGENVTLEGCQVRVEAVSLIDSLGPSPSTNRVVGRTSITVNGRLRATTQNRAEHRTGSPPVLGGTAQVAPAFILVARPPCTAPGTPSFCVVPCATCGNGTVEFPEQCEPGANGCVTNCSEVCRTRICADANPCTLESCDPELGCLIDSLPDGAACDNATVCDGHETCQDAQCDAGADLNCDDGNPCTDDTCDAVTGCGHTPLHNVAGQGGCDDRCVERCTSGTCTAIVPPDCNDNDPNTTDSCEPTTGTCLHSAGTTCTSDTQCNDGNPCTTDTCRVTAPRICQNLERPDGTACANGTICDGSETCQNGLCVPGTPPNCDDGDVCTEDLCFPVGGCDPSPIINCCESVADCNDGNPCTADACTDNRCSNIIDPGCCAIDADCDDGEPCTVDDCVGSSCTHAPAPDGTAPAGCAAVCGTCSAAVCQPAECPDDTDPCTEPVCDPVAGCTVHPLEGCCNTAAACDDGSACTNDDCNVDLHTCTHAPVVADCQVCAGNPDCDPLGACGPSVCGPDGYCVANTPPDCSDSDPRTLDRCVPDAAGAPVCEHQCLTDEVCNDGEVCNGTERCSAGACVSGPLPEGYARARCELAAIRAALAGAAPDDILPALRTKLETLVGAAEAKLAAAESATGKRAKRALGAARKRLKKAAKAVRGGLRKQTIVQAVADAVLGAVESATRTVDDLKAALAV